MARVPTRHGEVSTGSTRRTFVALVGATALAPFVGSAAAQPDADGVRTVVEFDPAVGELPESIAFDGEGDAYVTLGSGELRRFTPSDLDDGAAGEPFATVSPFAPGEDLFLGVRPTPDGTVYAVQTSPTLDFEALDVPASSGRVWRIDPEGAPEVLLDLPTEGDGPAFPNDLVHREDHGDLLVTDSLRGAIWRVTEGGDASVWLADPLLEANADAPFFPIGANGIAAGERCLYVANTTAASVVRVPVAAAGTAGSPELLAQDERLFGADGIALDADGNVAVATSASQSIVRVGPDGDLDVLAEGDGLAFPSDVAYGAARGQRRTLYVTNYDAVEALTGGTPQPSLAALDVDVAGRSV
jgi:sugar lactone lactonase YvrE